MITLATTVLCGVIVAGMVYAVGHDIWVGAGIFSASGYLVGAVTFQEIRNA